MDLLSWFLVVASLAASCQGQCPAGFTEFHSSCYAYVDHKQEWTEAQLTCNAMGGWLVEIFDAETDQFIVNMSRSHDDHTIWLGASDILQSGKWIWAHSGVYVDEYSDWAIGQPDDTPDEDCMELNIDKFDSHWNDDECDHDQRFICEAPSTADIIG